MNDRTPKSSAVHKVLDLLLLFSSQQTRFSVEDMSQALDIPKSTVYRHVRLLCEKGLLEKTGSAEYSLGLAFIKLGRQALATNRELRLIVLPSMKRIAEEVGESVSLMRIYNHQAVCIESIEGRPALRVTIERGRTQLLHAGASSKILLSGIPEDRWNEYLEHPLKRFTATTTTDLDHLKDEIEHIRQNGYCVSDGEIDVGARAIAVPLTNDRNEIIAALSIEAPISRMDNHVVLRYYDLLSREATRIHGELVGF